MLESVVTLSSADDWWWRVGVADCDIALTSVDDDENGTNDFADCMRFTVLGDTPYFAISDTWAFSP